LKIDLDHLHYWMQAIRQSPEPLRTMDAFWSGQLKSKQWLITNLRKHVTKVVSVDIHGGWVGTLASMLFQSTMVCSKIRSIDIDPVVQPIAEMMNKKEHTVGLFEAITADMCVITSTADVIINTSCEHITQIQYETWLDLQPKPSLFVLQSNNYNIPEHIRLAKDLEEFKTQCNLKEVVWAGELELPLYTRFMIIGRNL